MGDAPHSAGLRYIIGDYVTELNLDRVYAVILVTDGGLGGEK